MIQLNNYTLDELMSREDLTVTLIDTSHHTVGMHRKPVYHVTNGEEECCALTLTRGCVTLISIGDLEEAVQYSWSTAVNSKNKKPTYAVANRKVNGKAVYWALHQLISKAGFLVGRGSEAMTADHDDRHSLNNQRENLLVRPKWMQSVNRDFTKPKTGYRGVHETSKGWFMAVMSIANLNHVLCSSKDKEVCARAWDKKRLELFPDIDRSLLNFPEEA